MKITVKITVILTAVVIAGYLVLIPVRLWARQHVNSKTGVTDHPLLCTSCHLYTSENKLISSIINAKYACPLNLAASKDGRFLYIVAQDWNELVVVNTLNYVPVKHITVGNHPHSVLISADGEKAFVSNQWSDNVSVINLKKMTVADTFRVAGGPAGMVMSHDSKYLYVVNSYSSDVSIIDLASGEEINRLKAGNNPTGAGISPDGSVVFITSRRAVYAPYGQNLVTELTLIDDSSKRIREIHNIPSAHLMENIDFTPDGDLAVFTLVRPKNLVPSIQVENGFMMNHGFGVIDLRKGRVTQFLLDEPNAFYADPFDVVISKDGKKAFISSSGVDCISVISLDSIRKLMNSATEEVSESWADNLSLSRKYILARIRTGANPKGLALSPNGEILYISEFLEDRIAMVSTESLKVKGVIDIGGPPGITVTRHGRRLMNNAGHTFQNQFSCYSCHPDGHEDGLVYNMASKDMGRNITNTQSLRDIAHTAPFKWNGKNQTVYKQDGIRFSTVLTRTEAFSYKDLDAITAYILTGIKYPPNLQFNPDGKLTDAQERGKQIFERSRTKKGVEIPENNRCITCHMPPYYTNRKMADVNTLGANDD
ncbi:MAG TPA: beta-propeller fold lactonase family protein, partial [Bacteroidales bacterium]|nr:beta-propeller fold lactonase family protein [Bacteroidales bacterium]